MTTYQPIPEEVEQFGRVLLDAAMEVHRHLGPGFMERVYEDALCYELDLRGIPFEQQMPVSVFYKGVVIGGQRLDLVVGRSVIAELKAVQEIVPLHKAQLLSYLKATEMRLGYVLNFNVHIFKQGIKRMVL
ncbi:MAG: GxxExxY protein [Anaerolineae bacterium]|nr:GxxExxY protein [Anaerolineae bacterium]